MNMEAWHNAKISEYMALKSVTENNGWNVDLFPVEVGARENTSGQRQRARRAGGTYSMRACRIRGTRAHNT